MDTNFEGFDPSDELVEQLATAMWKLAEEKIPHILDHTEAFMEAFTVNSRNYLRMAIIHKEIFLAAIEEAVNAACE